MYGTTNTSIKYTNRTLKIEIEFKISINNSKFTLNIHLSAKLKLMLFWNKCHVIGIIHSQSGKQIMKTLKFGCKCPI